MITPEQIEAICARQIARRVEEVECNAHVVNTPYPDDGPECLADEIADIDALLAEVGRLLKWAEFTNAFADRTMPHAVGQGHLSLMSVRSQTRKALNGDEVFIE